ncbi:M10 family metallopeptidase C-terminal domain-containing protein [Roseovarius sp. 2305UL8-3]|uniref:M10 family metallopeptidase C-terminal domain-containing protein n=1 Tax=Roseovarius conchicola TaxID=3121636 RepID=UPI0035297BD6
MMTQTFDPDRHTGDEPVFDGPLDPLNATISESGDAASGISTTYTMSPGDTFSGNIAQLGDVDWVAITLQAGTTYQIDALGSGSTGGGTLYDTDLTLYNSSGGFIEYDDLDGGGFDAQITYTATITGTYYIAVSSYQDGNAGSYNLAVNEVAPPPVPGTVGTVDQLAEFLKSGTNGGIEYTFDTSSSNQITVDISGLTAAGQQLALWAMEAWEMVANLDFIVQYDGQGNEMITVDDEDSGAFAYYPNAGSTAAGVELNVSQQWLVNSGTSLDSYSFQTFVHEFGHAIGLNHLGNYNATPGVSITYEDFAFFTNDSWQMSVMSYFSQTENTSTNSTFGYLAGPMIADIVAIQDFYGAPGASSATAGNTTYGQGSNLGNYMDEIFAAMATGATSSNIQGNPMAFTIYDASGEDTINLSYLSASQGSNINLNGGMFSNIGTSIGVMGIAVGTVIENLFSGAGNDTITGNAAANTIHGNGGRDSILGGDGNDSLLGGAGFDTLEGGEGNDTLDGGSNADLLQGGAGQDLLIGGDGADQLEGGIGNDQLFGGAGADRIFGGDGADLIRAGSSTGTAVDGVEGGAGNDRIFGEAGFDLLLGGTGDDELYGGNQADNLYGEDGNDTLDGGNGFDRLFGGAGNDLLLDFEGFGGYFGGSGNDTIQSGDAANKFFGEGGNDVIEAGGGNDTIGGGAGFDVIDAGTGNDLIFGDFNADTFVFTDGHGADTVGDFDALNAIEKLDLSGITGLTLAALELGNASSGAATQVGGNVVIDTGGGNSITLNGVNISDLDSSDFIF